MCSKTFVYHNQISSTNLCLPSYTGSNKQCLLCGNIVAHVSSFRQHYMRFHSQYGPGRECHKCGQHFVERSGLSEHLFGKECPGTPVLYCQSNGQYYYRGNTPNQMTTHAVFPRFHGNGLVGNGDPLKFCTDVSIDAESRHYKENEIPLGGVSAREYIRRDFRPRKPPFSKNGPIVVVREAPKSRAELERLIALNFGGAHQSTSAHQSTNACHSLSAPTMHSLPREIVKTSSGGFVAHSTKTKSEIDGKRIKEFAERVPTSRKRFKGKDELDVKSIDSDQENSGKH